MQWIKHTGDENETRRLLMDDVTNLNATDQNGNSAIVLAAIAGDDLS